MHCWRHSLRINSTQSRQDYEIGGLAFIARNEFFLPLPATISLSPISGQLIIRNAPFSEPARSLMP